ncbi:TPA: hypothetical protein ON570_002108 [Citrobacter werkmanii]|nr:hypothetical protein [Citrobacter werkmanii]
MDKKAVVQVVARCKFFQKGMGYIFSQSEVTLRFIDSIDGIVLYDDTPFIVLLVLDMSGVEALEDFKYAMDVLNQMPSPKKIGVLVSRYNAYMTQYVYWKFQGRVTFFNSHNLQSGLFHRNFLSWLKGKTFRPMHVVSRFRDNRYGFSLNEWISLVLPLSGEAISDIACCMGVRPGQIYQIRQNALKKIGVKNWREFCELYLHGEIRTENDTIGFRST